MKNISSIEKCKSDSLKQSNPLFKPLCWNVPSLKMRLCSYWGGVDGSSQYKRPYRDVPPTWVAKSTSWYMNDPLQNAKFGIWMCQCFQICPNLGQNWLKFNKIFEKLGYFAHNLAKNWTDWCMNGSLFLEILVFEWVYFQILWWHIPTKTKLEYPLGPSVTCLFVCLICLYILTDLTIIFVCLFVCFL